MCFILFSYPQSLKRMYLEKNGGGGKGGVAEKDVLEVEHANRSSNSSNAGSREDGF